MADVELSVSLTNLRKEVEQGLAPIAQLLNRLAQSKDLEIKLDPKGAEFFTKQLEKIKGVSPEKTEALAGDFAKLSASFNKTLNLLQANKFGDAAEMMVETKQALEQFIKSAQSLSSSLQRRAGSLGQLSSMLTIKEDKAGATYTPDPEKYRQFVKYVRENYDAILARIDKKERDAVKALTDSFLQTSRSKEKGSEFFKHEWGQQLLKSLREADDALRKYVGEVSEELSSVSKALNKQRDTLLMDFEEKFKQALVGKGLKKLAPDIRSENFSQILAFVRGSPEGLVDTLYQQIIKGTLGADMSVPLGVEGLRDVVVTTTDKLTRFMRSNLMMQNFDAVQDLMMGGEKVFPAIEQAVKIFSEQLLLATNSEIRATAQAIRKSPSKYNLEKSIADMVADALDGAAKFLDERGPNTNFINQIQRAGVALLAREQANDNPDADFYKAGRQVRQQQLIDSYLDAFFPAFAKRLKAMEMSTDPAVTMRAAQVRGKFITNFGPSIDAAQGLLLNTLANFVSGLGVAAVFGVGYTLAKYIQDMETLNKELQAYKNILQLNYEEGAAKDIESLREELLDLAASANVSAQKVADLFGFFGRNNMAFDDEALKQLAQTIGFVSESFAVPFDQLKEKIKSTLLEQRQRLISPVELTEVVKVGGPQADKALDLFNRLMSSAKTLPFTVDELTKATRYYIDTGKDITDNYYDIARAVEYGTRKYEEHSQKLEKVAENYRDVDITNLFGLDKANERLNVQQYQRRVGLLVSRSGEEVMGNLGIGGPSVALASIQTSLLGLIELVRQATKLVGMLLDATGPLGNLVRALAGQAGVALTIGLLAGFFRLMNNFLRSIGKSTKEFTDELFKSLKVDPKQAQNLEKALKDGKGALARMSGAVSALMEGLTLFGRLLLRFLGPAGIAAAVLTAVGALTMQMEKQKQERIAQGKEVDTSVVRGFTPDGQVVIRGKDGKNTTLDLKKLQQVSSTEIIAAFTDEKLAIDSASIIRDALSAARNLGKALTSSAAKAAIKELEDAAAAVEKRAQEVQDKYPYASGFVLKYYLETDEAYRNLREAMNRALAKTVEGYNAQIQELEAKIQQREKEIMENWMALADKGNRPVPNVAKDPQIEELQKQVGSLKAQRELILKARPLADLGEALSTYDSTVEVIRSLLAAANKQLEMNNTLLTADPQKAPEIELQAKLNAINTALKNLKDNGNRAAAVAPINDALAQYAQAMQAVRQRERALALEAAQLLPSDFARLNQLLKLKQEDLEWQTKLLNDLNARGASRNNPAVVELQHSIERTKLEVEQQKKAIYAFEQELARQRAQAHTRLFQSVEEVFFPAQGGNTATAKLMQAVNQMVQESLNLPLDQFINMQKAIFENLDNLRPLAETYDQQVAQLERSFSASRRATDPKERFRNMQAFIDKGVQMVQDGQLLTGAAARFLNLMSDQLFKDGGQLSQLQQYTSQGLNKLEQLSRKNKGNDLGAQVAEVADGFIEVVGILGDVVDMEATFRQNVQTMKEVGALVYGQGASNLKKALAKFQQERQKLEAKARQGKLTSQEQALLKSYRDEANRLQGLLNLETELNKLREEAAKLRAKGSLSEAESRRLSEISTRVATLGQQLEQSKGAYSNLVAQADDMLTEVVSSVTTFTQKLGEALNGVVFNLDEYTKDLKEKLEQTVKSFKQKAEAFRPQSFKEDQKARLQENYQEFAKDLEKTTKDFNDLAWQLVANQKGMSGKALKQRILDLDKSPDKATAKALLAKKVTYKDKEYTLGGVLDEFGDKVVGPVFDDLIKLLYQARQDLRAIGEQAKKGLDAALVELDFNEQLEKAAELLDDAERARKFGDDQKAAELLAQAEQVRANAANLLQSQERVLLKGGSNLKALNKQLTQLDDKLVDAKSALANAAVERDIKALSAEMDSFSDSLKSLDISTKDDIEKRTAAMAQLLEKLNRQSAALATVPNLSPADRERWEGEISRLLERLRDGAAQLASKGAFDLSSLAKFIESVKPYNIDEVTARGIFAKFKEAELRSDIDSLKKAASVREIETLADAENEAERLGALALELDALLTAGGPLDQLGELGVDTAALVETVVETLTGLSQTLKGVQEKKLSLQETALRNRLDDADTALENALASGQGVEEALLGYLDALNALAEFSQQLNDESRRRGIAKEVQSAIAALSSRQGLGVGQADWVRLLLGVDDPLALMRSLKADLASKTQPELVAKIQSLLKEKGIQASAAVAEQFARTIIDLATQQVEKERKALEAQVNSLGLQLGDVEKTLAGLIAGVQQGQLENLSNIFTMLEQLNKLSAQEMSLRMALLAYDKDNPDYANQVKEAQKQHTERMERYVGQVGPVLQAIQTAYESGQIGYDAALQALQGLSNSLSLLSAFIETLAKELQLDEDQKNLLKKNVSELATGITTAVSKLLAEPMRLLTGEFASRELAFRQEARQAFAQAMDNRGASGAANALYGLPAQWLQSQANRPFFTMPWADEAGKIQAQRNLIMQALRLDDTSLANMFFGEEDAKRLAANAERLKETVSFLRAGLRGVLRDLEEQDLKRLENLLLDMVRQLQSGLESLVTSILNIPAQMLQDQYQHEATLRQLNDRKAALEDEAAMYKKLHDEAVKNFGATSAEAEKYRQKLAEVNQAQREWSDEFKRAKESAKSFFDYVLDALGQFFRMLSEALVRYAANYAVQAILGAVLPSGGSMPLAGASSGAPAAMVQSGTMGNVNPVAAVGQTLTSAAVSSVGGQALQAAGVSAAVANPAVALGAAVAGMAIAALSEEVGRWFDKSRFTFKEGKNAFADRPSVVDYFPNARPTVINVNTTFERQQLVREAARALDKKLREEEV
jgi:hypothetical protein